MNHDLELKPNLNMPVKLGALYNLAPGIPEGDMKLKITKKEVENY
jgi:hypothetical protein